MNQHSCLTVEEFLLVECRPLDDKAHCARRETTGEHGQVPDFDQSDVAGILGMEMWRIVVIKEHLDDNPEKAADLRHGQARALGWEISPLVVFPSP